MFLESSFIAGKKECFLFLNLIEDLRILFLSFFKLSKHVLFRFLLSCLNFPYALSG